ncbi:hypothetical protein PWT90_08803 [Aphanocladium album]|nr:hypothetical protein PWT90_08803 [Aphanocladium album]
MLTCAEGNGAPSKLASIFEESPTDVARKLLGSAKVGPSSACIDFLGHEHCHWVPFILINVFTAAFLLLSFALVAVAVSKPSWRATAARCARVSQAIGFALAIEGAIMAFAAHSVAARLQKGLGGQLSSGSSFKSGIATTVISAISLAIYVFYWCWSWCGARSNKRLVEEASYEYRQ